MKRYLMLCLPFALLLALGACSEMGRTAGTAQAKIENGINDLGQGYHDGYAQEKAPAEQKQD
ncbi:MAG: hypothetical protein LBV80_09480 [Deltaproteobacteria bacterium]|nr:hypothetical protein [Deltaproteobacteria bacterium]